MVRGLPRPPPLLELELKRTPEVVWSDPNAGRRGATQGTLASQPGGRPSSACVPSRPCTPSLRLRHQSPSSSAFWARSPTTPASVSGPPRRPGVGAQPAPQRTRPFWRERPLLPLPHSAPHPSPLPACPAPGLTLLRSQRSSPPGYSDAGVGGGWGVGKAPWGLERPRVWSHPAPVLARPQEASVSPLTQRKRG